ncbi:hypothetical protein A2721_00950 [Candidatus Gottesmanbacteria bacterium RIFCSPHIGHO2_01_FULL_47_48]|uniref:Glycosyltransferase 2-like domain-containing protein n=1 Tax=Candidatus Gottesmanbacteria bacterium RIFCSPHIGHO2_01_FULL_47_48 TaxID=1798381 RepID=A0A1F6A4Z6_9BACT|nr:MAG: hypothetical protein A2721_00950 [Candidatus Gottesmanbacteria bacterium RIFCSPHIGHO2_01_FULL_47_48]
MPKVSIIMPTHNRSWIIERAINSVLSQTFLDYELIVIDDASTDDTQEKLKQFTDERVVVQSLSENKKPAGARNEGIKLAKGDIIAFLDSDNVWFPNYLEVMVQELTDYYVMIYASQNMLLVGGDKHEMNVIGRAVRDFPYNPKAMTRDNSIDINCAVLRKSLLNDIGLFDETLKSLEDWDLFARAVVKYPFRIKHVSQVLGDYYFFLRDTESTIENGILTDERLLNEFKIGKGEGDEVTIREKINKLIERE